MNHLYYGDNLQVLHDHVASECVDLIYLDPPFNSHATYNTWFQAPTGERSTAQAKAFSDTWNWSTSTSAEYDQVMLGPRTDVAEMLIGMRSFLHENSMMAYLVMMTARMIELHRVLKPSGTLYLHCDPHADAYLRIMLDAVFGPRFVNSITRRRQSAHSDAKQGSRHFGRIHDTILVYAKSSNRKDRVWNTQYIPYTEEEIDNEFRFKDELGRYALKDMSGPGGSRNGNPTYEVMGVSKAWRSSKTSMASLMSEPSIPEVAKLMRGKWQSNQWYQVKGRIVQTNAGNVPMIKKYLSESPGKQVQDIWTEKELWNLSSGAKEATGWPTQKPVALLERIIAASSNHEDIVLDPCCGCGSTIEAAEKLGRQWIGIDITHSAINEVEARLRNMSPIPIWQTHGRPKDLAGAAKLATDNPHEFQAWAFSLVMDRTYETPKYGADRGVDGVGFFTTDDGKTHGKLIASVKGGSRITPSMVRDFAGTMERENAQIGVMILLTPPTPEMLLAANTKGMYKGVPKIQILTIAEWFNGIRLKLPTVNLQPSFI